ncbi:MAG: polyprenyl synthetase family protein [Bacteroidota bacterium]
MKTYKDFYTVIEQRIASLSFDGNPRELYDPLAYMLSLGGKRLRPVLVMMACDLFGSDTDEAIPAALAVEIFHNFTLVHDDIMDKAAIRRGKPTVHTKWNETVGILSGDMMMIKAIQLLCETKTTRLKELLEVFNATAVEVCEGQQIDMNFETRSDVSVDEYIHMITLKTAVLLGASLKLGALVANAPDEQANHLYNFGKNIGIAFQIQDDLLDSFGEGDKVGKKIGGDIAANKKTLLLIKAIELADATTREKLDQLLLSTSEADKITGVLSIYKQLKVKAIANQLKADYLEKAFAALAGLAVNESNKEALKATAIDLMERMS